MHCPTEANPYFLLASVSAGVDPGHALEELSTENIYSMDVDKVATLNDVSSGKSDDPGNVLTSHQLLDIPNCITSVSRLLGGKDLPFVRNLATL